MQDYCRERQPPPLVPPRKTSHPTFSATLLDAIYRSLDGGTPEIDRAGTKHSKPRPQPDPLSQKKKTHSDHFWWTSTTKRKQAPPSYTSSDTSSYGFSSDAEVPQSRLVRATRVQFAPPALPPRTPPQEKKKKSNPFRMRWRELRKGRTCANSNSIGTGTRGSSSPLSNFLKAIFSSSRTRKKNKNRMGLSEPQQGVPVPVLVPVLPPEEMEDVDMEAEAVKRRVEEILRGLQKDKEEEEEEEEEEDDDDDSDGSSDLFELENLTEIGTDELPVYCTTSLVANHPPVCCK